MRSTGRMCFLLVSGACALLAQAPMGLDLSALKQEIQGAGGAIQGGDVLPRTVQRTEKGPDPKQVEERRRKERELEDEVRFLKSLEKGPRRFAADLFDVRIPQMNSTEGGISPDYVLGPGDELQISVFGSATFEVPAKVDGRGEVLIPKVGSVKVAGKNLAQARQAVQAQIGQNFSQSRVDLSVTQLREIRVFVLGEVYKPGSYLVSSLNSVLNILSMAGGPTPTGSFREIRVMRGGKVVHIVDLYPMRAEGLGNLNFSLQSGDTLFVPLAFNQVLLDGAFTRVVADAESQIAKKKAAESKDAQEEESENALPEEQKKILRQIRRLETRLGMDSENAARTSLPLPLEGEGSAAKEGAKTNPASNPGLELTAMERLALDEQLYLLRDQLKALKVASRGDQRVSEQAVESWPDDQPRWLQRWQMEGISPRMQFELKPDETVADALRFAGGLVTQAFNKRLTLRRMNASGSMQAMDVVLPGGASAVAMERGDVLSALPLREMAEKSIELKGWVRASGHYSRTEGLRVGDLLKSQDQVLQDTYMARGEIVRTDLDGTTRYLAFDLAKALKGEAEHNLLLEDRDRIEIYRINDFRLRKTVKVMGPVTRPGLFEFHEGMRASDLVFRAGVPLQSADRFVVELARTQNGQISDVKRLDLSKLLSTESNSPVKLADETLNPVLQPYDQLSFFEKPDYRTHRVVRISGQVARPGFYTVDQEGMGIKALLERAGGFTEEAMPSAGIFLRKMGDMDPDKLKAAKLLGNDAGDPTFNGINDVLTRLSEIKRQPVTGMLLNNPLLHGLQTGALNRLVVNIPAILSGKDELDVSLQDGDEIIIPRKIDSAYVVGETASPFAVYKLKKGMKVKDLVRMAGGPTRNADRFNMRLLKADGRILDSWVSWRKVEPGDAVLMPQRFRKDVGWQENLQALTPIALILNAIK